MEQEFSVAADCIFVKLRGSMYVEDAVLLREKLFDYESKGHKRFHINLELLEYIDSSGLGVLVAATQSGGKVTILGLQGMVKEVFELTRLSQLFEIEK